MENSAKKTRDIPQTKKCPDIFRRKETASEELIKEVDKVKVRAVSEKDSAVSVDVSCRGEKKSFTLTEAKYGRRIISEFEDGTVVSLTLYTAKPINVGVTCWQKNWIYQFKLAA